MNWINLTDNTQLNEIKNNTTLSIVFKHSTRCSISTMAKKKFELDWDDLPPSINFYFLDLLAFRDLSNQVSNQFQIVHQSPQLLLIKNNECILEQSHSDICVDEINEVISTLKA